MRSYDSRNQNKKLNLYILTYKKYAVKLWIYTKNMNYLRANMVLNIGIIGGNVLKEKHRCDQPLNIGEKKRILLVVGKFLLKHLEKN